MKVKVLLVDDRKENLSALEEVLRSEDYELHKASSGQQALSLLLKEKYACVLLDVRMPDMDGFEVAKLIREDKELSGLPIIFVTAEASDQREVFLGYESGAVDFLIKPLHPLVVQSKVKIFADLFRQKIALDRSSHIEKLNQRLMHANQELKDFAYVASHDLKAPLRHVGVYIDFLKEDIAAKNLEKINHDLEVLSKSISRMTKLLDSLLDYSRIIRRDKNLQALDLQEIISDIISMFEDIVQAISAKVEIGPLPRVYGDRTEIQQLFQNLIQNALRYRKMDEKLIIKITADKTPSEVRIQIQDNGIGIAKEHQSRIFKIFERLNIEEQNKGAGIGLAICKKVMERHNGKIEVKSKVGEGSTFTIYFPN